MNLVLISVILAVITTSLSIETMSTSKVHWLRKLAAIIVELIHGFFIAFFLVGIITQLFMGICFVKYDITMIVLLNVMYVIVLLQFCVYNLCLVNVVYNRLLGLHDCTEYVSVTDIILRRHVQFERRRTDCNLQRNKWFIGNYILISALLILNVTYFMHFLKLI